MKKEIEEVTLWAESMIKSGKYPESTGNYRISALTTLTTVLADDEPHDVESLLANLDDIALRWATKNMKTGETTNTYHSRAKGLLSDFITWRKDPGAFKGRRAATPRPQKPAVADTPSLSPSTELNVREVKATATEVWETVNLGNGRVFKFVAPDLTVKDAARVAWALAVRASDFDPTNGSPFGRQSQP